MGSTHTCPGAYVWCIMSVSDSSSIFSRQTTRKIPVEKLAQLSGIWDSKWFWETCDCSLWTLCYCLCFIWGVLDEGLSIFALCLSCVFDFVQLLPWFIELISCIMIWNWVVLVFKNSVWQVVEVGVFFIWRQYKLKEHKNVVSPSVCGIICLFIVSLFCQFCLQLGVLMVNIESFHVASFVLYW